MLKVQIVHQIEFALNESPVANDRSKPAAPWGVKGSPRVLELPTSPQLRIRTLDLYSNISSLIGHASSFAFGPVLGPSGWREGKFPRRLLPIIRDRIPAGGDSQLWSIAGLKPTSQIISHYKRLYNP